MTIPRAAPQDTAIRRHDTLNGGACQEITMTVIPIRLRDREILDAQLVRCRQIDNSFTQGAAAGLRWLTSGGPGPVTGTLATSIHFQSIVHELAAAEAIIYGPPSSGRDYAYGLEHALLWAENATTGPPVPTEAPGRSAAQSEAAESIEPGSPPQAASHPRNYSDESWFAPGGRSVQ